MNPAGIDTSALLTMLGLIAAVWAVVPSTARLSFRLSLHWFDWLVIWAALLIIHGLFFQPVLTSLGFPTFGPWLWGFDKSATQYLLFLLLAAFVYWRSRRTRLTRWNLGLFDDLTTSLLHAGKFEELADLLYRHLASVLNLAASKSARSRLANAISPPRPGFQVVFQDDGSFSMGEGAPTSWLFRKWFNFREWFADLVGPSQRVQRRAAIVVKRLLSSRRLTGHLAIARPYLCMEVMERATRFVKGFQDEFFDALLANEASILYSELNNNENFGEGGHRLALPDENRLLRFYCFDVDLAARLGVYRSVGEAVLARIDADEILEKKLNGRLLTFQDVGKHHDPVYAGIRFFRIMVLEGLHQRVADHLWLHYMPHFASRLVDRAREVRPEDESHEFPTPLGYLLYEVVDGTAVWVRDADALTKTGDVLCPDQLEGNHIHISFEAAEAIGRVIRAILMSPRVPLRLKGELFGVALTTLRDLEQRAHLAPLARVMRLHLIEPYGSREQDHYLHVLKQCFDEQDHVLRAHLGRFSEELDAARGAVH
ncbi:hypothetical protein [Pseudomonas fluorescens]|uniref:Uncharacterized protein n=1 Tax=Pseudomonas fluorescens TaxID=294 RepID=A0A944HEP3_PSEFL|nr:hypothetical protein [Pseudomonas fluorescens]MBT2298217.1 hypothetical protein [Pseudomonas fluorescens]MBT2309660.1 hypothetical protein [Pseudomonas fluorescens]MBT2314823.1 hypothetical protein [Pseudomonas fluorescens]MBT2327729.1 hypothetical protein [Pseudomonas fluorescens]MBT2345476.1 hypothetical protein [Pseudomonas fluorescens]